MRRHALSISILLVAAAVSCVEVDPGHRAEPVIGGGPTPSGEFPATGALIMYGDGQNTPLQYVSCTGTLIAPDVVLTAAHCTHQMMTQGETPDFTLAPDGMNAPSGQIYAGASALPHPSFNPYGSAPTGLQQVYDVGLLFLEEPITGVTPEVLPRPGETSAITQGSSVDIVGYGFTVEDDLDHYGVKNDATTHIAAVSQWELQIASPGEPQNCQGDSGGPSLLDLGSGRRLIGVVSRGTTQDQSDCSKGGIHTRIDGYLEWIHSQADIPCGSGLSEDCDDTPDAGTTPPGSADAGSNPIPFPDAGPGGGGPDAQGTDDQPGEDCPCSDDGMNGGCSANGSPGASVWWLFILLPFVLRRRQHAS